MTTGGQALDNSVKLIEAIMTHTENRRNNWSIIDYIKTHMFIIGPITECVLAPHHYITTNLIGLINYHHSLGIFYTFDTP